jgi:hypothetical protein
MKKKKVKAKEKREGYSLAEMRMLTRKMIDESVERLRRQLRSDRLKQKREGRVSHIRHGVAV